ncbi:UPF0575 protein C19orf67 homolog isoform 2-T2 [Clarias gariepinus]
MENTEELPREELLEMLSFLEDIKTEAVEQEPDSSAGATAPPVGGDVAVQFEACLTSTEKLHAIEQELKYLLSNVDEFLKRLSYRNVNTEKQCFTRVVPAFLKTSQPFFIYLESTARNRSPGRPSMSQEIRDKLLQFSQELCSRTEHLILTYASHGYLTLDESDPLCRSHFHIGKCEVENIELSIFRYCQPTPLLTLTRTGLYKRIRWNVRRNHMMQAEREDENNRTDDVAQEMEGEQGYCARFLKVSTALCCIWARKSRHPAMPQTCSWRCSCQRLDQCNTIPSHKSEQQDVNQEKSIILT